MNKAETIKKIIEAEANGSEELSLENIENLPPEISRLVKLRKLRLADNKNLTTLPSEIGQLKNLEILYLQHCTLSTLPAEIGNLTNLRELNLRGNKLKELPSEIGMLINLEKLNLSENEWISLPSEIWQLINLKSLYLVNIHLRGLPSVISKLNLITLDVAGNQFLFPPQDIVNQGFSAIKDFFLNDNAVETAIEPLLQALKDDNDMTRRAAPRTLREIRDLRAVVPLINALRYDEYHHVREEAAIALGKIKDFRAVGSLIEALNDDDSEAMRGAKKGLEYLGLDVAEPLIDALMDPRPLIRVGAAEVLADLRAPRAVETSIAALQDKDEDIVERAIVILSKFGAIEPLITALHDQRPHTRVNAARALGKIFDPRVVEPLIAALKDEDVRETAAYALGNIGDTSALDALVAALKGREAGGSWGVVDALKKIGWSPSTQEEQLCWLLTNRRFSELAELGVFAVEALIRMLKDRLTPLHTREYSAEALGEIGDTRAIEALIEAMEDEQRVREAAVRALESMRWSPSTNRERLYWLLAKQQWDQFLKMGAPAIDLLSVLMKSITASSGYDSQQDMETRTRVAKILFKMGEPVLERLCEELENNDFNVRMNVAIVLARGKDPRALKTLISGLNDYERAMALAEIGEPAVDPLINALKNQDKKIRKFAVLALGKIDGSKAIERLVTALKDEDGEVREFVVRALEIKGWSPSRQEERLYWLLAKREWDELVKMGPTAVDPLILALKDRKYYRRPAAKALSRIEIKYPVAVELLIEELKNEYGYVREVAAELLGKMGDPRAVEPLTATLKDRDLYVRKIAKEALGKIRDIHPAEALKTFPET